MISKHKFKSLCNKTGGAEDITLLLKVSAGGRGKAFSHVAELSRKP